MKDYCCKNGNFRLLGLNPMLYAPHFRARGESAGGGLTGNRAISA